MALARTSFPRRPFPRVSVITLIASLCVVECIRADQTGRGRIAVLKDALPVGGDGLAEGIASNPDHLVGVLRDASFGVSAITARDLAGQSVIDRERFDLLILPYGPSFPLAAADSLRRFLRQGGKLISVGGYAFDNLLERTEDGWQAQRPKPPSGPSDARWRFDVPADEIRGHGRLTLTGWTRTERVTGRQFAFLAVYQYDAAQKLLEFKDVAQLTGTTAWRGHSYAFRVHHKAARVTIHAGIWQSAGQAWFSQVRLLDDKGQMIVDATARPNENPDAHAPKCWFRTEKACCSIDASVRHGDAPSLSVRLDDAWREVRLNTRSGRPMDGLEVEPTQLGLFDADYRIRRAESVRPATDQYIFKPDWSIRPSEKPEPIQGYAASGVLGYDEVRWRPLINAYDAYGRPRGAAGAMMHHYAGPWKGSSWAFFGLTRHDVFAPGCLGGDGVLLRLAGHLIRDVYLVSALTDKACYRQGEGVAITVKLFNGGRDAAKVALTTSILADRQTDEVYRHKDTATLAPGATGQVAFTWSPECRDGSFYVIRAELRPAVGAEEAIDVVEGGFVIRDQNVLSAGPKLLFRDNYVHVDDRPIFMFGTDDWSYVFSTPRETPLQWRRDMAKRRDFGVTIYENLQIGLPPTLAARERFFNQVEGVAQLSQQFRQVYFPCLLCGQDVAVDEATLRKQAEFAGAYAQRFADTPGLIYYLNGDLRCRITEAVRPEFDRFLRDRYASDAELQAAWGGKEFRLGRVAAQEYSETGAGWDDVRAYDMNVFRAGLIRRWHNALIEAIRRHDTAHPTTSEFYQLPYAGVDVPAAIGRLDLSNIGYFDEPLNDIRRLPSVLKYSDLRARGKSFGPGEYGVKTHPAWSGPEVVGYHKARTPEQAIDLFLAVAHYTLGLGGSRVHNWCWKDSSHRVFPWGMLYPCDEVEKDTAYVHRNLSLLFRHFRPVYAPPAVYVMTPDTHRLGGKKRVVIEGVLNSIQLVLACHVDSLGMLNELALVIPAEAKVIFLPVPFCLSDEAYEKLTGFVRGGGTLYLSGDVSFDALRRRRHTERLEGLCGVRFVKQRYAGIDLPKGPGEAFGPQRPGYGEITGAKPCIDVEPAGADIVWKPAQGNGGVFERRLGRGRVVFTPDPIELRTDRDRLAASRTLYQYVLDVGRARGPSVGPDNPYIHVMRTPLQDGGEVLVFFNADESADGREITYQSAGRKIGLSLRRHRPGLLWFDGQRRLRGAEVQGRLMIAEQEVLSDDTGGIVLSLDGNDLARSAAMVLMPLRPGGFRLASQVDWRDGLVEVGEVRHGVWQGFEQLGSVAQSGTVSIDVGARQVFSLLLVCRRAELAKWRGLLEETMRHPANAK
ncbi:MAG: hypothetical protein JXQ73_02285 [Phycisphaerae bacterium]|nr:hypothetical protein [Phycisphaerae bacterium]